jgi:hypothetical protein
MEKALNTKLRIALTSLVFAGAAIFSTGSAMAWGCIAVSEEGSYGYSYNYDDEDAATRRALNECAKKTTTESTCEITECTEGS